MGGDAAKERRRLKRLQSQQDVDGKAAPSGERLVAPRAGARSESSDKKRDGAPNQTKVRGGENGAEAVRLRLQRKMARKASGKFKPQSSSESSSPSTQRSVYASTAHKRKPNDAHSKTSKFPYSSSKTAERSSRNNQSFRQKSPSNGSLQKKTHMKDKFRQQKRKPPAKKSNNAKPKVKNKPKHLKRKMDHLSKTISEGTGSGAGTKFTDLEKQMKQLVTQMEEFKKLKQNNSISNTVNDIVMNDLKEDPSGNDDRNELKQNNSAANTENEIVMNDLRKDQAGTDDTNRNDIEEGKKISTDEEENEKLDSPPSDDAAPKSDENQTKTPSSGSSSSSSSSDDDESDADDIADSSNARSRGKRRRGRKSEKTSLTEVKPEELEESPDASKKTPKKDDKRRCIGRKPVTDFIVGKTYSGKVRYIKPKLGAFIDIGSHSDAFCHISCVSNDFVSSVADILKADDVVQNVRIVEIDREKKRITVSLRSEDMVENERERLQTTRQYEKGLHSSRNGYRGNKNGDAKNIRGKSDRLQFDSSESTASAHSGNKSATDKDHGLCAMNSDSISNSDLKRERKLARRAERRLQKGQTENTAVDDWTESQGHRNDVGSSTTLSQQKSGADLKRERKLARRAERRAAKEVGA